MSRRVSRAERLAQVQALLADGLTNRQIADRLGMSVSGVRNVLNDPDGSKQRARRVRYQGRCRDCGGPTDGSNGRANAPERCDGCRRAWQGSNEGRASRTVWTRELLLDRIREWAVLYGEPPAGPDWNQYHAEALGNTDRAERWRAANGHWPWHTHVVRRFGSWNAAIRAAGFEPRGGHGGDGNVQRRRRVSA